MSGRTVRTSDHPRSRGVYPPPKRPATRGRGIIPARAGFTRPAARRRRADGDHPRSRGVYRIAWGSLTPPRGSSPLARGLQPCVTVVVVVRRIIPARAGFTTPRSPASPTSSDHPRSRGVYAPSWSASREPMGSSPLARGLPGATRSCTFTPPDHPRSRGVYTSTARAETAPRGSSPLARGLPLACEETIGIVRIIPARAGFTPNPAGTREPPRDHPRSRGVYASPRVTGRARRGSSPLARGLPLIRPIIVHPPRIIPARAGFTARRRRPAGRYRDHPRSRGVYG